MQCEETFCFGNIRQPFQTHVFYISKLGLFLRTVSITINERGRMNPGKWVKKPWLEINTTQPWSKTWNSERNMHERGNELWLSNKKTGSFQMSKISQKQKKEDGLHTMAHRVESLVSTSKAQLEVKSDWEPWHPSEILHQGWCPQARRSAVCSFLLSR